MRCPHTDWVRNVLTVTGPAERLATLQAEAAGAGVTPWAVDYDRLEENLRVLMLAVPRPRRQTSLEGCRIVARELREWAWEGHERAVGAVGVLRHVPFDLHSLVPVPWEILRLGDEDPRAVAWLWTHWGTTWTLRHVRALPRRGPGWRVEFWSADWTPWPVIRSLRARYPELHLVLAADTGGQGEAASGGRTPQQVISPRSCQGSRRA